MQRVIIKPVMEVGLPAVKAKTQLFINNKMILELPPPSELDHIARGVGYKRELEKVGFRKVKWVWKPSSRTSRGYYYHELSALPPVEEEK